MKTIPESAFAPRDVEAILGLSRNRIYALIREGHIETCTSPAGQMRISRDEVIRYAKKQERIQKALSS